GPGPARDRPVFEGLRAVPAGTALRADRSGDRVEADGVGRRLADASRSRQTGRRVDGRVRACPDAERCHRARVGAVALTVERVPAFGGPIVDEAVLDVGTAVAGAHVVVGVAEDVVGAHLAAELRVHLHDLAAGELPARAVAVREHALRARAILRILT